MARPFEKAAYAPVAQLDRVLASGAKGRGFESRPAYHNSPRPKGWGLLWYMPKQEGIRTARE